MGRRPAVENLRKDVKERLDLVRSKFADLKFHTWKPKRYVPEISEAVAVLSKRTRVGESTLWNSQAPYLSDIKRLLAAWATECTQLVVLDTTTQAEKDQTGKDSKGRHSSSRQQLLDALNQAQEDLEHERAAHSAARRRIEWLEKERRVLEAESANLTAELQATRSTLAMLQSAGGNKASSRLLGHTV